MLIKRALIYYFPKMNFLQFTLSTTLLCVISQPASAAAAPLHLFVQF